MKAFSPAVAFSQYDVCWLSVVDLCCRMLWHDVSCLFGSEDMKRKLEVLASIGETGEKIADKAKEFQVCLLWVSHFTLCTLHALPGAPGNNSRCQRESRR